MAGGRDLTPEQCDALVAVLAAVTRELGSQRATASLLGVTQPTVNRVLTGKARPGSDLARALEAAGHLRLDAFYGPNPTQAIDAGHESRVTLSKAQLQQLREISRALAALLESLGR